MYRKKTHKEFLEELYEKNDSYRNGEFEVLGKYEGLNTPIRLKDKYGYCSSRPAYLLQGARCSISNAINKEEYLIKQFEEKREFLYDYSKIKYKTQKTKIEIVCKEHGSFWQSPDSHKKGHGCSKCSLEKRTLSKDFIEKWLEDNNFDDSRSFKVLTNRGCLSKIEVVCKAGHKYCTTFNGRRNNNSCLKCHRNYLYLSNNDLRAEDVDKIPAVFYFLKLTNQKRTVYKVGLSRSFERRLYDIEKDSGFNVEVIYKQNTTLKQAYESEEYFLDNYKNMKASGLPDFGGKTECFVENPLNYEYYYN